MSSTSRSMVLPSSFDFAIYRASTLGKCLKRAMDRMVNAEYISADESKAVMPAFDRSINKRLEFLNETNQEFLPSAIEMFRIKQPMNQSTASSASFSPITAPLISTSSITLRGDVQAFRFTDDMWILIGRNLAVQGNLKNGEEKIQTIEVCKLLMCKERAKRRKIG
jgi:hypothetical protein